MTIWHWHLRHSKQFGASVILCQEPVWIWVVDNIMARLPMSFGLWRISIGLCDWWRRLIDLDRFEMMQFLITDDKLISLDPRFSWIKSVQHSDSVTEVLEIPVRNKEEENDTPQQ